MYSYGRGGGLGDHGESFASNKKTRAKNGLWLISPNDESQCLSS